MKKLAVLAAATGAVLAGLLATPTGAEPRSHFPSRQSYVEQPHSSNVKAASATVLLGNVSNARGLTSHGQGDTTLSLTSSNAPATVVLDYGVEVEGAPQTDVESFGGSASTSSLLLMTAT